MPLLTTQGLNFLLLKSSTSDDLAELKFNDADLELNMKTEMNSHVFHHHKLDTNLLKAIQDPFKLVSGGLSEILKQIF